MIDWQGLLKFSLQYSDGTKSSQFTQMSEQDKKWLQQAMKHYCNSEIQRIKIILEQLVKPQIKLSAIQQKQQKQQQQLTKQQQPSTTSTINNQSLQLQNQQQHRLHLLQQLQQILDSLDKGTTLYKMNGHIILLRIIFYSKYQSNKVVALQIFSSINQNDAYIQTQSINSGALELVQLIQKQESIKLRENMFTAISSMLRGENLQAKRIFVKLNGLELLQRLYNNQKINSNRLKNKIFILMRDLLYYDDRLQYTYNDLSSFSNTSNVVLSNQQKQSQQNKMTINQGQKTSKKDALTFDKNKQVINNQVEENKKFKGCVKRWLLSQQQGKQLQIAKGYLDWLKEQQEREKQQV